MRAQMTTPMAASVVPSPVGGEVNKHSAQAVNDQDQ